jgi:hypothetical protein
MAKKEVVPGRAGGSCLTDIPAAALIGLRVNGVAAVTAEDAL